MCKVFSLPSAFYKMSYHSTNTLYIRLPYHTIADKVNEFVLGGFMLVLGVSRLFSVYLGGFGCSRSRLGTPMKNT